MWCSSAWYVLGENVCGNCGGRRGCFFGFVADVEQEITLNLNSLELIKAPSPSDGFKANFSSVLTRRTQRSFFHVGRPGLFTELKFYGSP